MKLSTIEESGQKIKKFDPEMQKTDKPKEDESLLQEIHETLKEILDILRSK